MGMEKKDILPKTMQPPRYISIEHSEKMKESGRKIKDKNILNKQTNNQETFNKTILGWIIKKKKEQKEQKTERLCYY